MKTLVRNLAAAVAVAFGTGASAQPATAENLNGPWAATIVQGLSLIHI